MMSKKRVVLACIVMILSLFCVPAVFANTIIVANQSCRTRQDIPDENNHDTNKLTIRTTNGDPTRTYKSWVKFDLRKLHVSSLGTATLTVTLHQERTGSCRFDISYVNDDCRDNIDWNEDELTWNNAPGNNTADIGGLDPDKTTLLTTVEYSNGVPGDTFTIDILEALESDTDGIVQFVFHNSSAYMNLASSTHTEETYRPFLTITEGPNPADGATDVPRDVVLSWLAGKNAVTYDVYFGTDINDVNEATIDNPLDVLFSVGQEETTYASPELLESNQTYYWRVDEVNDADPNSPWKGDILSFTTGSYIIVDDFESYNDINPDEEGSNRIYLTWTDGYDNPTVNGSTIGYPSPSVPDGEHFVETETVHGGSQSAPLLYDNSIASYSEVSVNTSDLTIGNDWTKGGVQTLTLWFYGDPNNAATEQLYVKLNGVKIIYDGDAGNLAIAEWSQWDIELSAFGINLADVTELAIGLERVGASRGSGMLFIDSIRLYEPAIVEE
jgi:hypothetical protein